MRWGPAKSVRLLHPPRMGQTIEPYVLLSSIAWLTPRYGLKCTVPLSVALKRVQVHLSAHTDNSAWSRSVPLGLNKNVCWSLCGIVARPLITSRWREREWVLRFLTVSRIEFFWTPLRGRGLWGQQQFWESYIIAMQLILHKPYIQYIR